MKPFTGVDGWVGQEYHGSDGGEIESRAIDWCKTGIYKSFVTGVSCYELVCETLHATHPRSHCSDKPLCDSLNATHPPTVPL